MKVLKLAVHNVLGIKEIDVNLEGHNLFLVGGRNGQGKSSTLKALAMILCGKSGMDDFPEMPLRDGEDEGFIEVKMSGNERLQESDHFTAKMVFKRKRGVVKEEELIITDSSGERAPTPRRLMQSLFKLRGFDPLEFARMKPKDQRTALCGLLGIDLETVKQQRQELYQERALINKQGVSKKALAEAMPFHADAPSEPVDASKLMAELQAAEQSNSAREAHVEKMNENERAHSQTAAEIDRLTRELAVLQETLREQTDAGEALLKEFEAMPKAIDTSPLQEAIDNASATNQKVQENKDRERQFAELEALRNESAKLTAKMKELDESHNDSLAKAEWPIPGMTVDEDGILLNGIPLDQCCQRDKTLISAEIAMRQNPELRLMISERGSELDQETRDALDEILKARDFQAIIEVVTSTEAEDERCSLVIHEGKAK